MSALPEIDAYRVAKMLIDRHGEEAEAVAARSADEAHTERDIEKEAAWRMIGHAVEELQRQAPKDGERVN
jgi:hypothetical protein